MGHVGYGNGGRTAMILRGFRRRIVEIANAYFIPGREKVDLASWEATVGRVSRLLRDNF